MLRDRPSRRAFLALAGSATLDRCSGLSPPSDTDDPAVRVRPRRWARHPDM
ncbi:hypothetical protein HSB1_37230 [Halogranum salarium B-1]|uniref:Twin-arginine translocation signal domain-containing protein n=1 Tax=Halogranum salarium B-1 TaxID=1210908 RepID=J3JEE9_9EURY|nr:hypothetical protein HSB1_37230 [Halogranum salarium B-1]